MTSPHRIAIRCTPGERPVWEQILATLNDAFAGGAQFSAAWQDGLALGGEAAEADIACLSLLPDLFRPDEWPILEAEWRALAADLHDRVLARGAPVFLVTIFRYLPPADSALLPRLRRLNLLAAKLSQEFGMFVIDLDRVLAHRGAVTLGADARLGSAAARDLAAATIIDTLLGTGIDHLVDDATLQQVIADLASQRQAARERLSVPVELMRLERRQVKAREQVYGVQRDLIDDRSLSGLLRDLRALRIGPLTFARHMTGKISDRIARRRSGL